MVGEGGVGVGGRPLATRPSPAAPAARRALDNAVSIAASLLNTEAIVADDEVDETDELDYQPTVGTGIGEDAAKYAW